MRAARSPCALLLLAGLLLPSLATAEEADPAAAWARTEDEIARTLHELARWCASAKLFAARAEVYEGLLLVRPDDETARKWLRYRRGADGRWERKPNATRPRDRSRRRDDYEARRAKWETWLEAQALEALEAAEDAGDVALKSRVLGVGTHLAPGSEALRTANGEIRVHDGNSTRWLLVESRLALERRRILSQLANDAIEAVPAPKSGFFLDGDDVDIEGWPRVLKGERVRVLGTPDERELKVHYEYCEACWPVFRGALSLGEEDAQRLDGWARGMSVYVFADLERGNAFLARQPGVTERYREFTQRLAALWIPNRAAVLVKAGAQAARLEAGPKQILGGMSAALFDLRGDEGWISETLDHYLVYLITGTRILSSVTDPKSRYGQPRPGLPDVAPRAIDQDDWLRRGLALVQSDAKPDFFLMVGKNVNDLAIEDVLYAYCIVAYVIEGRAKSCANLLHAIGEAKTTDLEPLVQRHLGFDVATLEARVHRWLRETTEDDR